MPSYPFLSDEWLEEARKIRAEYEGKTPPIAHVVRMNLVVTQVPFSEEAILIEGNPQAGMQAFMSGKVRVEGDMAKLMALQATPAAADPSAAELATRIRDITE